MAPKNETTIPPGELKNISFPACSDACAAIRYLGSGECKTACPDKFNYKILFIVHMTDQGIPIDHALAEYEAHVESVGERDLTNPRMDADECMSHWQE